MKTTENNKLIAEFMGLKFDKGTFYNMGYNVFSDGNLYCKNELKYHTEWNWLMPVVSKCHKIDESSIRLEIGHKNMYGANIDIVYEAVVEFIKEYNKQN